MKLAVLGPNQTEIQTEGGKVFFSYNTPVAAYIIGRGYIVTDCRWSRTTSKHINAWLHGVTAEQVPQSELDNLKVD